MWPVATDFRRSVISVSVCALVTLMYCAKKRLNRSRCRSDGWLMCVQEPCIRLGSISDESIRSREGRHVGDTAFCQTTSDTFPPFVSAKRRHNNVTWTWRCNLRVLVTENEKEQRSYRLLTSRDHPLSRSIYACSRLSLMTLSRWSSYFRLSYFRSNYFRC